MGFNAGTLAKIVHPKIEMGMGPTTRARLERQIDCWRRATAEDSEKWYAAKRKAIDEARAKGEDTFSIAMDDGGEPRLPPQDIYIKAEHGMYVQIVKGRTRARRGYYDVSNCAEVMLPSGEIGFIEKKWLINVS